MTIPNRLEATVNIIENRMPSMPRILKLADRLPKVQRLGENHENMYGTNFSSHMSIADYHTLMHHKTADTLRYVSVAVVPLPKSLKKCAR